jgi:hypothetical protein
MVPWSVGPCHHGMARPRVADRGKPTRGGPPVWWLGKRLTSHRKNNQLVKKCWNTWTNYKNLTPWSRILEKLIVTQPVEKVPAFYWTCSFITVFTGDRYWSLSWARWIQCTTSYPISLRSILILSSHLRHGSPSGLCISPFPTKILYAFLDSSMRASSFLMWLS